MRLFGYPYNDLVICKDSPDIYGWAINGSPKFFARGSPYHFYLFLMEILMQI